MDNDIPKVEKLADKIAQFNINPQNVEQHIHLSNKKPNLPSNIPSAKGFKGRKSELQQLQELYESGSRVFVLCGLGGAGKTSLAQKFVEGIKADYDAHVFVNLGGTEQNSLSVFDAMLQILHSFNLIIPEKLSATELKGLYVSLLNQFRILLFLDNAKDRSQVEQFNKSSNSCLLVTSRVSLVVTDGRTSLIKPMSQEDARLLLFSIAGEERFEGHGDVLASIAGYLPMALLPLAGLLAENELESVDELIHKYQDRKKRLELADPNRENLTVLASFDLSYETLTVNLQNYWRQLAVFPSDFDKARAQAVWKIDSKGSEVSEILNTLFKYNLITYNKESNQFSLHDLARDFLREKASKTELTEMHIRAADFCKSIHLPLDRCYSLKDFETRFEEMNHCYQAEEFDRAVFVLGKYESRNLRLMGSAQRIIAEREKLRGKSQKLESESFNNSALGLAYKSLGDFTKAKELYQIALKSYRRLGDFHNVAIMLMNMGNLAEAQVTQKNQLTLYRKALKFYEEALTFSIGDNIAEAAILTNIATVYLKMGNPSGAINIYNQQLLVYRKFKDKRLIGMVLGNIASCLHRKKELSLALKYFDRALRFHRNRRSRNPMEEGRTLGNKGLVLYDLGKCEKSCQLVRKAQKIAYEIKDTANIKFWENQLTRMKCNSN